MHWNRTFLPIFGCRGFYVYISFDVHRGYIWKSGIFEKSRCAPKFEHNSSYCLLHVCILVGKWAYIVTLSCYFNKSAFIFWAGSVTRRYIFEKEKNNLNTILKTIVFSDWAIAGGKTVKTRFVNRGGVATIVDWEHISVPFTKNGGTEFSYVFKK